MWAFWASSASSLLYLPGLFGQSTPIDQDLVVSVEERCCHLEGALLDLIGGRHSYIVLRTASGKQVRLDYYPESQQLFSTDNYWEILPQELFRRAMVREGVRVKDVKRIFQKYMWRDMYSPYSHNCQHVVLSTFNEVTGLHDSVLRNDYLVALLNYLPAYMRRQLKEMDPEDEVRREMKKTSREELRKSENPDELVWKQLKLARFDTLAGLMRSVPVFDPHNPEAPDTLPDGSPRTMMHVLTAYGKELEAWERAKGK